eukprot:TRINITY_DN36676_c0_g1_i1.p1 TRINITY_DN36676_c0_g1~~TRINITY_DN36676_c0_g1_i1.p1  ORF type:complete len:462 (+),score=146.79 TRINITY_DN36676_c0_g1_i1:115-1500(+)
MNQVVSFGKRFFANSVLRTHIGVFGAMNAGKSTLMNILTQSETSIVDNTPGTTADTKVSVMQFHELGPVKLFDTPGINETGLLGDKKRQKAWKSLKQADISVIVLNPFDQETINSANAVVDELKKREKTPHVLLVHNLRKSDIETAGPAVDDILEKVENELLPEDFKYESIALDFHTEEAQTRLINFFNRQGTAKAVNKVPLLPPNAMLDFDSTVLMNIPMDGETPSGRLLRPQSMAQEQLLRKGVNTMAFRMDLGNGRSDDLDLKKSEEMRFRSMVDNLKNSGLSLIITDSQAMDLVHPWTLDEDGNETIPITTFSIMMINFLTGGRLPTFVEGLERFKSLKEGDRVLICEACNHNRIQDDIGTVQLPRVFEKRFGDSVSIEHAFGREYESKQMSDYDLILHCGGCMLDAQHMQARLADIEQLGVPITNYGTVLSYIQAPEALERVLVPWNKTLTEGLKE